MSTFTVTETKRVREFIFNYQTCVATIAYETVIVDGDGNEKGSSVMGYGFSPGEIDKVIALVGQNDQIVSFIQSIWTQDLIDAYLAKVTPPADLGL